MTAIRVRERNTLNYIHETAQVVGYKDAATFDTPEAAADFIAWAEAEFERAGRPKQLRVHVGGAKRLNKFERQFGIVEP